MGDAAAGIRRVGARPVSTSRRDACDRQRQRHQQPNQIRLTLGPRLAESVRKVSTRRLAPDAKLCRRIVQPVTAAKQHGNVCLTVRQSKRSLDGICVRTGRLRRIGDQQQHARRARPLRGGLPRQWKHDGGERDETFGRGDLTWAPSSLLYEHEHGDLENKFISISEEEAAQIVERIRGLGDPDA